MSYGKMEAFFAPIDVPYRIDFTGPSVTVILQNGEKHVCPYSITNDMITFNDGSYNKKFTYTIDTINKWVNLTNVELTHGNRYIKKNW